MGKSKKAYSELSLQFPPNVERAEPAVMFKPASIALKATWMMLKSKTEAWIISDTGKGIISFRNLY